MKRKSEPMEHGKNETTERYKQLFENYIAQIESQIQRGIERDFDAPSALYQTQMQARKAILETPEDIKKALVSVIGRLEGICKEATEETARVPNGDAWLEKWK